ncbi:Transcriptional regulator, contains XRE-family HTH domain [Lentzea xinjiangensis]|uniref:Transcriptional regulator, contains XRE-family HTH domain n=1 Tax=Lentzea xinjiangensis TaxID=402600 RepID=A0A1H9TG39_9PSEU|nr:helix-turn-helix transcriptional regulator [Lentzea xinjiangensis]SER96101.1 Transcriptional regulator, contains XRE-family HTH domain [Lentzea xinjiangensis]
MDSHRGRPFGDYLRAELKQRDMTAYQLAEKTGIAQPVLSRWMGGKTVPTIDNLRPVAEALNLPLLELVVRAGLLTEEEAGAKLKLVNTTADKLSDDELLAEVGRRMKRPGALRPPTRAEIEANPERFIVVDPGKRDHREPGRKRS